MLNREVINLRKMLSNKRTEVGSVRSDRLGYELLQLLNENHGNILESDLYIKASELISCGANFDFKEKITQETFLMKVVKKGYISLVELLCNVGADLDLQDINLETALMKAANQRVLDIVRKEFKNTGNVTKAKSIWCKFIPMVNDYLPYDKIMRLLIENHCILDTQDKLGLTALDYATRFGAEFGYIRMLIKSGANPLVLTEEKYPRLASDLASGNDACVKYLLNAEQEWIENHFRRPSKYSPEIYFAEMDKQAKENNRE
ncbi:MAG: ankyrin repeat domain-containing protein [Clostridia bacterium]|jgi:ankyrin repeat protein|nr:ankyrin repeat domain-containing protein [Clostridia bacterium]